MVRDKEEGKGHFSYPDYAKMSKDSLVMAVEFMKYQTEVAYEVGKKQAISITSTASSIGIGWSAFFFGLAEQSWIMSSFGIMMVFVGTFFLGYWTPRILNRARRTLDTLGASKFRDIWSSESSTPGAVQRNP